MSSEPPTGARDTAAEAARWKKVATARVVDLGLPDDLAEETLAGLDGDVGAWPPRHLVETLIGMDRPADAVRALAFCLPKREGVWWACLAARADVAARPPASEAVTACQTAAEAWVYKPVEERRQACQRAAAACRPNRPSALAALAAAFSSGSLTPPDSPPEVRPVPPADDLTPTTVGNAVILAAVRVDPAGAPDRLARFLAQGIDIANGGTGAASATSAAEPPPPET